ncbi:MAG: LacI family transcriptional regulator [Actinomycetia bacterium]|nr:LacI family transcriptional regulator [Actinomycetes bacterium]
MTRRPPTMEDVAEAAGVSRALVSLVMRQSPKVSAQRREAVLAAADRLGYRPNVLARNLASRRTRTVGFIIDDLHNPYHADVAAGAEEIAAAEGYRILINTGWRQADAEQRAVETMLEFRTDGIILAGPRLDEEHMVSAGRLVPIVAVGRAVESDGVDTVNNDEIAGARLAVEHLVELGHREIVHFDGGQGAGAATRRFGYEQAMTAAGLADQIKVVEGNFTEISGVAAAEEVLRWNHRPTAVFAANDLMAAGALDTFEEAGWLVPDDLSIVGYDNTALAAMQHMSLSTINQPRHMMGRLAMEALLERLDDTRTEARHEVLTPELVPRKTSGPAR